MRSPVLSVVLAGAAGLCAFSSFAAILQVGPTRTYATIQAAVAAANESGGDIIEVDEGTYTATSGFLFTLDRPVVVKAVGAQDKTTLKAAGANGAAKVADAGAVLFGFTFDPNSASVPTLELSNGVVSNCVFKGTQSNAAQSTLVSGGLLEDVHYTSMKVQNANPQGGGVKMTGGTVRNCTFRGLYTWDYQCNGMALQVTGGLAEGCVIEGNVGSGANQTDGDLSNLSISGGEVRNCVIRNNGVRGGCAGVYMTGGTLHDSLICGNVASNCFAQTSGGAGVRMTAKAALMYNCIVSRNCTLFDAERKGYSGIQMSNGTVSNCVVYGNCGGDIYKTGGTVKFTCSGNTVEGEGNVCADAQLRSPETGDFSLLATAPVSISDSTDPAIGFSADRLEAKAVDGFATIAFTALKANIDEGLTYTWDFGDGSDSATGENVSHDYAPGLYTVTLTAGSYSCTRTKIIKVIPPVCHVWTGGSATIPYDTKEKAAKDFATAYFFGSDEIDVHPGTYECLAQCSYTAVGRAVHVKGIGDRSEVIFTGLNKGNNRAMVVGHPDAIVENVTLTKGQTYHNYGGGGVYIGAGLVSNCVITANNMYGYGGACLTGGRLTDCVVSKNENISGYLGAGVYVGGAALVDNCVIRENKGNRIGGTGVALVHDDAIVSNCTITLNTHNSTRAEASGAGVHMTKGLVVNCVVSDNTSTHEGAGIRMTGGTVRGTLVTGNSSTTAAVGLGGGIYQDGGTVESSTVVNNTAASGGAGIHLLSGTVLNSIVYGNGESDIAEAGSGTVTYTCSRTACGGEGNTTADPSFVDAANGDFHLTALSSAVKDKGLNQPWMEEATDLDGTNRIVNTTVDMGCYEFVPSSDVPFTVDFTADVVSGRTPVTAVFTAEITKYDPTDCTFYWSFSDGTSVVVDGLPTLERTFEAGRFSASLCVSNGTEGCSRDRADYVKVSPESSYVSKEGSNTYPYDSWEKAASSVAAALETGSDAVYVSNGVYEVTEGISLTRSVRVVGVNGPSVTRIRRAASLDGKTTDFNVMAVADDGAWLEGVTVSHGVLEVQNDTNGGNTLRLSAGTVTNCVVSEGRGYMYGAVAVRGGLLVDSVVSNNLGSSNGAVGSGLSVFDGVVSGCLISGNSGNGTGSANSHMSMGGYVAGGIVSNCTFTGNFSVKSDGPGAGLAMNGGLVTHCFITNNVAGSRAGGVMITGGELRNCLVVDNRANGTASGDAGGGIRQVLQIGNSHYTGGVIDSCTVTGNRSAVDGAGIYTEGGVIRNTIVWGNGTGADFVNVGGAATVTDCFFENPLFQGAGDYRLTAFSSAVDAGTPADWMVGAKDLAGTDRIVGSAPDIGAYELNSTEGFLCHFDVATERRADYMTVATFTAQVRGATDDVSYFWTWGDGTAEVSGTAFETHVYAPGKYTAKLRVVSGEAETEALGPVTAVPHEVTVAVGESIAAALATGADIVRLASGTHEIAEGLTIDRAVELTSVSGDPADTVIYAPRSGNSLRVLKTYHPEARVVGLTLRGGIVQVPGDFQPGSVLWLQDGLVENCILEDGRSYYRAAVWVEGGTLRRSVIRNCQSTSSSTSGAGLGLMAGLVDSCVITNNNTMDNQKDVGNVGGGVYLSGTGVLRNSLVASNRAPRGGGIYVEATASGAIENCTIVGNDAWKEYGVGGGVYVVADSDGLPPPATIRNNIVWGNAATVASFELNLPSAFSYSCSPALTAGVNHNLAGDPLFRRPAKGDWRLRSGSPCVGTGIVADWMSGATDLRGRARKIGGAVSMGAYECMPNGLSVIVR